VPAAQLLLLGSAIWLAFFWLRPWYLAKSKVRLWSLGIGVYSATFVLLSLMIVQNLGYIGIAISLLAVTIVFHFGMTVICYET
jgi:O-antigen/teichoic acid export membrane protein